MARHSNMRGKRKAKNAAGSASKPAPAAAVATNTLPYRPRKTAKNARSKRAMDDRLPKLVENTKKSIVFKGNKSSDIISQVLKDFHQLKKPESKMFTKKNATKPFEDHTTVEFLSQQNDCSLFAFGSHTKKKPHGLTIGRLFDNQLLDMVELCVEKDSFMSMQSLSKGRGCSAGSADPNRMVGTVRVGSKPMFVFQGSEFETEPTFVLLRSLLLDYFRGDVVEKVNLVGLDRVIVCTAHKGRLLFRHYGVVLKKSGTKIPDVELRMVGPKINFKVSRVHSAPDSLRKQALRKPKVHKSATQNKNIERGNMGERLGRIHMEREDLDGMALRKFKGIRERKGDDEEEAEQSSEGVPSEGVIIKAAVTKRKPKRRKNRHGDL